MIEITCYGEKKVYKDSERKKLMDHFLEGMLACDGSERDRYTSIYCGLEEGCNVVDDEWDWNE